MGEMLWQNFVAIGVEMVHEKTDRFQEGLTKEEILSSAQKSRAQVPGDS